MWAWTVSIQILVIIGVLAYYKSPLRVLKGVFGSVGFRLADAYNHRPFLFPATEGIIGSTNGRVGEGDSLVMRRGCCEYSVLRMKEKCCINNGPAYVGNKTEESFTENGSDWQKITT
jgi:hypothetical protein